MMTNLKIILQVTMLFECRLLQIAIVIYSISESLKIGRKYQAPYITTANHDIVDTGLSFLFPLNSIECY